MKIALDPYMHRRLSFPAIACLAAELGYPYIELSPRWDFFDWFVYPRIDADRIREFKAALRETGVQLASLLPLYRWASLDEDERLAAVRNWKRAIEIAIEMECQTMNSEFGRGPSPVRSNFGAGPETRESSETAFLASLEDLLPIFERVHHKAGETKTVSLDLAYEDEALRYWDETKSDFVVDPGPFDVLVGASSADIRLKEELQLSS